MANRDDQFGLSLGERCRVLGIATAFLLVLSLLAWLAITYAAPATILDRIPEYFRAGKIRSALGLFVTLFCYVIGLPVGLILSSLGIFHGATGKRTRLTRWILRELSRQEVRKPLEQALKSHDAEGESSKSDKVLHANLPPAVGWAILLGVLVVPLAVLAWFATRAN